MRLVGAVSALNIDLLADKTLRLRDHVVLQVSSQLHAESHPVLVKHLSRDEWEVLVPIAVVLLLLHLLLDLVVKLLLVIEEEEFILEDIRASHLHSVHIIDFQLDAVKCITLLLQPQLSGDLVTLCLVSHLSEMLLQDILVVELLAKVHPLTELDDISAWVLDR